MQRNVIESSSTANRQTWPNRPRVEERIREFCELHGIADWPSEYSEEDPFEFAVIACKPNGSLEELARRIVDYLAARFHDYVTRNCWNESVRIADIEDFPTYVHRLLAEHRNLDPILPLIQTFMSVHRMMGKLRWYPFPGELKRALSRLVVKKGSKLTTITGGDGAEDATVPVRSGRAASGRSPR